MPRCFLSLILQLAITVSNSCYEVMPSTPDLESRAIQEQLSDFAPLTFFYFN
jgi:hypothetical protein